MRCSCCSRHDALEGAQPNRPYLHFFRNYCFPSCWMRGVEAAEPAAAARRSRQEMRRLWVGLRPPRFVPFERGQSFLPRDSHLRRRRKHSAPPPSPLHVMRLPPYLSIYVHKRTLHALCLTRGCRRARRRWFGRSCRPRAHAPPYTSTTGPSASIVTTCSCCRLQ